MRVWTTILEFEVFTIPIAINCIWPFFSYRINYTLYKHFYALGLNPKFLCGLPMIFPDSKLVNHKTQQSQTENVHII